MAVKAYHFVDLANKRFIVKMGERFKHKKTEFSFLQLPFAEASAMQPAKSKAEPWYTIICKNKEAFLKLVFFTDRTADKGKIMSLTEGRTYWTDLIKVGFRPLNRGNSNGNRKT